MKPVKKFATFDDLKSLENTVVRHELSVKKHNDFEKVIKYLRATKEKSNQDKPCK